ncbi:hypothetical protein UY3_16525 [Chelonia mydas]|uniref:Uncharacterized protein n=1 Tax=Chelonia mydas TaxID=8469 RepID=M7BDV4_CHEMY|nr:hypothetical protein UY3_16525 [Chelonia mydas]
MVFGKPLQLFMFSCVPEEVGWIKADATGLSWKRYKGHHELEKRSPSGAPAAGPHSLRVSLALKVPPPKTRSAGGFERIQKHHSRRKEKKKSNNSTSIFLDS